MADRRQELTDNAKMAEHAERYEDMVEFMKELVNLGTEPLLPDERNLLSAAYKNVVGARRSAWRVVSSIEHKSEGQKKSQVTAYREQIEKEVAEVCEDLLKLVDDILLPSAKKLAEDPDNPNFESKVFFLKMKADYYRYIAEVTSDKKREEAVTKSEEAYSEALGVAEADPGLQATNQVRLGLALNFSVFHYEIKNDQDKACKLAKSAFDGAIALVDTLDENSYKDTTLIMQLLRDNLMLWTAEQESDMKDDEDKND